MNAFWTSPHGRQLPKPSWRTLIMGILNVTPDSFSDGGAWENPGAALEQARRMIAEGADVIDIGGESTRPGANPVSPADELARVLPMIERIRRELPGIPISIDTYKAEVAAAAIDAGADIINDVWGARHELPEEDLAAWTEAVASGRDTIGLRCSPMAAVAAGKKCPLIVMHNRRIKVYSDFWREFLLDLRVSIAIARQAGVPDHQLWMDPGFGFGKEPIHNLESLKNLDRVVALGFPVILGTSRKSTIGLVLDRSVDQRHEGTAATCVWGIAKGCSMVRVHEVAAIALHVRMADAIRKGLAYSEP